MEITEAAILEAIKQAAQSGNTDRRGLRMVEIVEMIDDMSPNAVKETVKALCRQGVLRGRRCNFIAFHGQKSGGIEYVLVDTE